MISWSQIEVLISVRTTQDLTNAIFTYSREAGFDSFAVAIKFSERSAKKGQFFTRHNYASEQAERFSNLQHPEYADKDERVALCTRNMPAIAWDPDGWIGDTGPLLKGGRPQKLGGDKMKCGIVVPLSLQNTDWGFVTFSTCRKIPTRELDEKILDSIHFINYCSLILEKISAKIEPKNKLSSREAEVLEWAAVGKTSWEVGQILDLSERTINFHLSNAADKLGVKGRRAACTAALARGYISI